MHRTACRVNAREEDCMERPDLNGLIAAIVTPMRSDLSIDEESLRRYVDWLVGQGIRGLAVNVDTGEGPHLFPGERLRVLKIGVEKARGQARGVAGLGASVPE